MKKVFVTVGTTQFDALTRALSHPKTLKTLRECGYSYLTIQYGQGEQPKIEKTEGLVIETFRFLPSIERHISESDLVISHAGAGTVLETLGAAVPLITVVNDSLMHNHQTELAQQMSKDGHLLFCTVNYLVDTIREIQTAKLTPYVNGNPNKFADFLDKVLGF